MAVQGRVVVETMDGVGLLTFAGADAHNAFDPAMWRSLEQALERMEQDGAVRVVVLTGSGHIAFATDAAEEDPAFERDRQPRDAEGGGGAHHPGRATLERLGRMPKPVLARVRGECVGAGLAVALRADIRIAAADSAFALTGSGAERLGAEPALVDAVGLSAARFLLLTGSRIEANEAVRIGLVTRVVQDSELSDTVADLARQLADQSAEDLAATKRTLGEIARSQARQ